MRASPYDEAYEEAFTHWAEEIASADLDLDSLEAQDQFNAWMAEGAEEAAERQAELRKEDRGW
jgi:hypothetical protein